ncbi:MAG TPA: enoyl-CoA hydratase/isomerase family protein [Candidatus Binataceae bacterium]|jgi:enoyl-CoA hydratase/carnithine racemase|nr:enoyl-CoA hydratase/isomerase family protein [Candidatus Binataceae bacterium]
MPENFLYEQAAAVATITFNRPERRNCMTREVMLEFEQLVHRVRDTPEIRVLIVTGTGTAFSAGANVAGAKGITDPRERARIFAADNKGLPRIIGRIFDTVLRLDALTIGAVNGYAVGGGWALAAAMDFVIAAESAEFWLPEVELGAPFVGGPAEVIARRVGPWRAKEIMILCRHYMARDLLAMGMVNQVVRPDELLEAARALAADLIKLPRGASIATKHVIDGVSIGPRLY